MAATTLLSDNGVSSGITGYQLTGGDDGTLELQTTTAGGTATTAMTINASQNVGIGTSSPVTKLTMAGNISFSGNQALNWNTYFNSGDKYIANGYAAQFYYDPSAGTLRYLNAGNNVSGAGAAASLTDRFAIDSSGNVGIGTSSPAHKLDIDGNTNLVSTAYLSWNGSSSYSIQGVGGGSGYVRVITGGNEAMRIDASGNLRFNSGYGSAATAYGCRAWVSFNGTGTVAIRGSGNVSSITDNGTGNYTVNYTTAMPDANYAVNGTVGDTTNNYGSALVFGSRANLWTQLTSSISFIVSISSVNYDATNINVSVFR